MAGLALAHPSLYSRASAYLFLTGIVLLLAVLFGSGLIRRGRLGVPRPVLAASAILGISSIAGFVSVPPTANGILLLISPFLYIWAGLSLGGNRFLPGVLSTSAVIAAGLAGMYGLLQFGGWDFLPNATRFHGRMVSFFENPNYFANFAACALPIGLAATMAAASIRVRIGWSVLVCVTYAGLLISGSRGAWWGAVAGVVVTAAGLTRQCQLDLVRLHRGSLAGLTLALVAITLLLRQQPLMPGPDGPIFLGDRLASSSNIVGAGVASDRTINHRYQIWQVTWNMIANKPVIGYGVGLFREQFVRMRALLQQDGLFPSKGWDSYFDPVFAHNEFLHIWAERGFFGLLGFLGLVGVILHGAIRAVWQASRERLDIVGFLGLVTAILVHGQVSYPLQLPLNGTLFWLSLGILANRLFLDDQPATSPPGELQ